MQVPNSCVFEKIQNGVYLKNGGQIDSPTFSTGNSVIYKPYHFGDVFLTYPIYFRVSFDMKDLISKFWESESGMLFKVPTLMEW